METVGSTDNVKIVVMVSSLKTGGVAKYYYLSKHTDELPDSISSEVLKDIGSADMSSGNTLETFVDYVLGKSEYQAEHYMLVLADHGGGWRGFCWDEKQDPEGGAYISLPELKEALSSYRQKFRYYRF